MHCDFPQKEGLSFIPLKTKAQKKASLAARLSYSLIRFNLQSHLVSPKNPAQLFAQQL